MASRFSLRPPPRRRPAQAAAVRLLCLVALAFALSAGQAHADPCGGPTEGCRTSPRTQPAKREDADLLSLVLVGSLVAVLFAVGSLSVNHAARRYADDE